MRVFVVESYDFSNGRLFFVFFYALFLCINLSHRFALYMCLSFLGSNLTDSPVPRTRFCRDLLAGLAEHCAAAPAAPAERSDNPNLAGAIRLSAQENLYVGFNSAMGMSGQHPFLVP